MATNPFSLLGPQEWTVLSKKSCKEILQSKKTK